MKKLFLGLLLLSGIHITVSGQINEIELGMAEAELLLYINPREFNDGFETAVQKPGTYVFVNKTNPEYLLQIEFKIKNQLVSSIKKTYTGTSLTGMDILSNFYAETIKDWSIKSGFKENPVMSQKALQSFKAYHPKVATFQDEEETSLFMFMIYQTSKGLIFTQMERAY